MSDRPHVDQLSDRDDFAMYGMKRKAWSLPTHFHAEVHVELQLDPFSSLAALSFNRPDDVPR